MNETLKKMTYYVVELSFRSNNPIHRAICFHRLDGHVELFGSYEGVISKRIEELAHFEVVEEIKSMNEKSANHYLLPNNIKA